MVRGVSRVKPLGDDRIGQCRCVECQHDLAHPGAVHGHPAAHPRAHLRTVPVRQLLHVDDLQPVAHRQMDGVSGGFEQVGEIWGGDLTDIALSRYQLA